MSGTGDLDTLGRCVDERVWSHKTDPGVEQSLVHVSAGQRLWPSTHRTFRSHHSYDKFRLRRRSHHTLSVLLSLVDLPRHQSFPALLLQPRFYAILFEDPLILV